MTRKDCDTSLATNHSLPVSLRGRLVCRWWVVLAAFLAGCIHARAGNVRLWPTAVVVSDEARLSDLCELRGFEPETERRLTDLVVSKAPPAGGTRIIHLELIRSALSESGVNMSELTLRGAIQCALSRPQISAKVASPQVNNPSARHAELDRDSGELHSTKGNHGKGDQALAENASSSGSQTLRQSVVDHFNAELTRFGGHAEVTFDQTSESILDLSSPPYSFHVRSRRGALLGLVPLDVEVVADNQTVQAVPLVVRVVMVRPTLVARRTIGQDATISENDIALASMTFGRLDHIGLDDPAQAMGQRAKRLITAGTIVEQEMLESVPLVKRGELVTLASVVGGIRVVTTAKAAEDGLLGEVVKVRALNRKGQEFDAVVTGPAEATIGQELRPVRLTSEVVGLAK